MNKEKKEELAEMVKQALNLSDSHLEAYYSFSSDLRFFTSKEGFYKDPISVSLGLLDLAEEIWVVTIKNARERILLMKEGAE